MATKEASGDVESSQFGFNTREHNETMPKLFKSDMWIQFYETF